MFNNLLKNKEFSNKNVIELAPRTFIFVALPCEAKPLIQAWRLKKPSQKQAFSMYCNDHVVVTVSGIGKIAMAGAVAHTMAQFVEVAQPVMLNLGVAGHQWQTLGDCFLADKVVDADTGRCFYPQLPFDLPCQTLPLKTLSKPDAAYADDFLCDMEASAFYEIAAKFSSSELIHCLKVVSDNTESPLENITEDSVITWLEARVNVLEDLILALIRLRQLLPIPDNDLYGQLIKRFHFTASNAVKLQSLLSRWQLLIPDEPISSELNDCKNGKEAIAWMEKKLEAVRFCL